jgi:hypothetical protein
MSTVKQIRATLGMLVLLALLGAPRAVAGTIYAVPLPILNLNNAAGANRSNIAPVQGSFTGASNCPGTCPYILGDDFRLADAGLSGQYNVNTLSVWEVGNVQVAGATDSTPTTLPSGEFSSITLLGGVEPNDLTVLSSSYTATRVFYAGGLNYQSPNSGNYFPIYRLDFTGLSWIISSNVIYDFAINGVPIGGNSLALSAMNIALSGVTPPPDDNSFIFYQHDPATNFAAPFIATFGSVPSSTPGFPKGSDINVSLDLSPLGVPEPSTISFLAFGLGGILLGLWRRK